MLYHGWTPRITEEELERNLERSLNELSKDGNQYWKNQLDIFNSDREMKQQRKMARELADTVNLNWAGAGEALAMSKGGYISEADCVSLRFDFGAIKEVRF